MKHIACNVKDCYLPAELEKLTCPLHLAAPVMLQALRTLAFEPIGPSDASYKEVFELMTNIAKGAIAIAEGK
jgi:hypothetical protein